MTTFVPVHPDFGRLIVRRPEALEFRHRRPDLADRGRSRWKWVQGSKMLQCIGEISIINGMGRLPFGLFYTLLVNFKLLMSMERRSDPGTRKYNFLYITLDDPERVYDLFDTETWEPLPKDPQHVLVPAGWSSIVCDLWEDGIFSVDEGSDLDTGRDRDAYYGHNDDRTRHVEITLGRGRWEFKPYVPKIRESAS